MTESKFCPRTWWNHPAAPNGPDRHPLGIDNSNGRVSSMDMEDFHVARLFTERFGLPPYEEGTATLPCGHTTAEHEAKGTQWAEEIRDYVAAEVQNFHGLEDWTMTQVLNAERWDPVKVAIGAVFTGAMVDLAGGKGRRVYEVMASQGFPLAGALVAFTMGVPVEMNGRPVTLNTLTPMMSGQERLAMIGMAVVSAVQMGLSGDAVRAMDVRWGADRGNGGETQA